MSDMPVETPGQVWGYRMDVENHALILRMGLQRYAAWKSALTEYYWEPPVEVDISGHWRIENQRGQGACQGEALSASAEICQLLAKGEVIHFSRNFAYLCSQRFDGLLGRDAGSSLSGGSRAAQQIGFVPEDYFPYSDNYRANLSKFNAEWDRWVELAAPFKMHGDTPLSTYEDILLWIQSGKGPVQIGIGWSVGSKTEITRYLPGGGGHSVIYCGYVKRRGNSELWLQQANSWGESVGERGMQYWHPDAVRSMCRSRGSVVIGRSEMESPEPRPIADL
jgi:hypothetical protein